MTAKKAVKQEKQKQVVSDGQRKTLRLWNIKLAALLVAEAVAIVLIGGAQTVPITTGYLAVDQLASQASGHEVLAPAVRHLADVHLSWVVAKFLLIFALVYLLSATLLRARYEAWLERGINKLRWIGFGFGGGAIAVTVAMLSGISELSELVLIYVLSVLAGLSAMAVSLMGSDRRLRKLLVAMTFIAAVPVVGVSLAVAPRVALFDGMLPSFVYYIYASGSLLLIAGVLASYFRLKMRGKWADTYYSERMFMFLGALMATVIAWQIFAGALQS
jgi:hypothetical protein